MNIYTWIFTGCIIVSLLLYIIALAKNIGPMEKTVRALLVPFLAGIIISLLAGFLPDSHHIIFIVSLAFSSAVLFMLSTLNKNKFFKFIEHSFFIITQVVWFILISSVYRIFKIPDIFFILSGIVFIAGFVVICVFIKKQNLSKYVTSIIQYAVTAVLCTTALINLVYEKRIFGILIFLGALVTLCHVIFEIFQRTRPFAIGEKTEKVIVTILFVLAQALMGAGAILLQV